MGTQCPTGLQSAVKDLNLQPPIGVGREALHRWALYQIELTALTNRRAVSHLGLPEH